ncbi:nitroreductase family protein [Loigolactobacillus binensis]|uniref:Nitroreductase family protein n=1 Tax=Loigolactobacillus binensis TaxID=2559922 RepID=A0ABW3EA21_9LACO|nr:nitroreductase family protein [Loigolactobacillus binensis]
MADLEEMIRARHSVREFEPDQPLPTAELNELIKTAALAPSAMNKQPLRYLVLDSADARTKLLEQASFNQSQIKTASSLVLIATDLVNDESTAFTAGNETPAPNAAALTLAGLNAGLAGMQLMLLAQNRGYVTNPMTGFNHDKILSAFGLDKERYIPLLLIAIGKNKEHGTASERKPLDQILLRR